MNVRFSRIGLGTWRRCACSIRHNFVDLEPYGDNRQLRMVVETPRGSNIKLEYEPELRAFTVSRALHARARLPL